MWMRTLLVFFVSISLGLMNSPSEHAYAAGSKKKVQTFATLPPGPGHPEGMTANNDGDIFVATFELAGACPGPTPSRARNVSIPRNTGFFPPRERGRDAEGNGAPNFIHIYNGNNGNLRTSIPLDCDLVPSGSIFPPVPLGMIIDDGGAVPFTGTGFEGSLFVLDVFHGDVLRFDPPFNSLSEPAKVYDLCGGFIVAFGFGGTFCALNDITIGPDGNLYIGDNGAGDFTNLPGETELDGKIYRLDPDANNGDGDSGVWYQHDLLDIAEPGGATTGHNFPAFSVNGLVFNPEGNALFIAHMGDDRILKLPVDCVPAPCEPDDDIFKWAESLNGVDDMDFDNQGRLWVTTGQDDMARALVEIPAEECNLYFDGMGQPTHECGQVVKSRGGFIGVTDQGAIRGMLMPSSIVVINGWVYVCNEANPGIHPVPFGKGVDGWEDITAWTVARFRPNG